MRPYNRLIIFNVFQNSLIVFLLSSTLKKRKVCSDPTSLGLDQNSVNPPDVNKLIGSFREFEFLCRKFQLFGYRLFGCSFPNVQFIFQPPNLYHLGILGSFRLEKASKLTIK
jgi:hypothetical protein